jgi:RND superfamily putative drug exporter
MLTRIASFSYRRRRYVIVAWIVLFFGMFAVANAVGDAYSQQGRLPGADSQKATDLLSTGFGEKLQSGQLVYKATGGVKSPAAQSAATALMDDIAKQPGVRAVLSPYSTNPKTPGQISVNGQIASATIQFTSNPGTGLVDNIKALTTKAEGHGVQFELAGQYFGANKPPGGQEAIGLLAAIIVLLFAFGSVLAMGLPILTALIGIGIGSATIILLSNVISIPTFGPTLGAMIGLGVGIDYALFIVTRYRQGLRSGLEPERAVMVAIDTAGRAVVFAGTTVVISLLGMLLMGISFVQGLGVSASFVVLITLIASITLLPALLGFSGHKIDKFALPGAANREAKAERGFWFKWSRRLQRRPWPPAIIGLLVLLVLAIPLLSMRLGSSDASNLPTTDTTRRAYDLQTEGFGAGYNGTFIIAAQLPRGTGDQAVLAKLEAAFKADPDVATVLPAVTNQTGDVARMILVPKSSPQDQATLDLLHRLRDKTIPAVVAGSQVHVYVGGITAVFEDFATQLQDRLPLFIGAVLILSFLLLLVVFRSIVVPIKAVIMNLLSIGAAYGVIVAVFQWGWLKDLFGVAKSGPIESFVPMMMFAILFGLSMDYEVFLLSRIKEEYDRTKDNGLAVADGLSATARVITAAAIIMVCVFGSFIFGDNRVIKEFGLGLSVAILIDATIVRMILVPATMELLGDANWWFPKWLQWLPRIHVEGSDDHFGDAGSGTGDAIDDELHEIVDAQPTPLP